MEKKCKVLAIVWDVIVALATVEALICFAVPSSFMGSTLDMRWMLIFAALGIAGAVLFTISAFGKLSYAFSVGFYSPPALLALNWCGVILLGVFQSPSVAYGDLISLLINFGAFFLPVLAYTGGFIIGIYALVMKPKVSQEMEQING